MSASNEVQEKFDDTVVRIEDAFTYGVVEGKFSFEVPLSLSSEHVSIVKSEAAKRGATPRLYGKGKNLLYLQYDQLTQKQSTELLNQGRMIIDIEFVITGTFTKRDGTTNLKISIRHIRKIGEPERTLGPAPQD